MMSKNDPIFENYVSLRRKHRRMPAAWSLQQARDLVAAGKGRTWCSTFYPYCPNGDWGKPDCAGGDLCRWVERAGDQVSRRRSFADEVIRLDHTGWFADADGFTTHRGVIFQLPAKDGKERFLAGYVEMESARGGPREVNDGSALVCDDVFSDKVAAARWADRLAERSAENAREESEAWQAGREWSDCGGRIEEIRSEVMGLTAAARVARRDVPDTTSPHIKTLCGAIRDKVSSLLSERGKMMDRRRELSEPYGYSYNIARGLWMSFNDGAGERVIKPKGIVT
jgi:hypothetical protein